MEILSQLNVREWMMEIHAVNIIYDICIMSAVNADC